jgi:hypothetical protein
MLTGALTALLITVVIEVPIVALIFSRQRMMMAACCLVATSVTNFSMNTLLHDWASSYAQYIIIGELGALCIEALAYGLVSRPRDIAKALLASAVANAASYAAGLFLFT